MEQRLRVENQTPDEVRARVRSGEHDGPTGGLASGYVQANLVVLPEEYAFDFLKFCVRNQRPCPILEVTDAGSPVPPVMAPGADLRTDVPRYRVYENGELVDEPGGYPLLLEGGLGVVPDRVLLYIRGRPPRRRSTPPPPGPGSERADVRHGPGVCTVRAFQRADGGQHATLQGGRDPEGGSGLRPVTRRCTGLRSTSGTRKPSVFKI